MQNKKTLLVQGFFSVGLGKLFKKNSLKDYFSILRNVWCIPFQRFLNKIENIR